MLKIRFFRAGKRNQPFFKIVVIDKKAPTKGGRPLENLGFYNPLTKEKNLKKERVLYWISVGAKPSDTVYNLLIKEGIVAGKKISVHKKKKAEKTAEEPSTKIEKKEAVLAEEKVKEEKPEEKAEKTEKSEGSEGKEPKKEKESKEDATEPQKN